MGVASAPYCASFTLPAWMALVPMPQFSFNIHTPPKALSDVVQPCRRSAYSYSTHPSPLVNRSAAQLSPFQLSKPVNMSVFCMLTNGEENVNRYTSANYAKNFSRFLCVMTII